VEEIGVEKMWINDLEEVKSVEKCEHGKKHNKFMWKNITFLVVCDSLLGRNGTRGKHDLVVIELLCS
jgi:hypothetical protein